MAGVVLSLADLRAQVAACKATVEWQARVDRWALQTDFSKLRVEPYPEEQAKAE